jgi:hypothetical protein
MRPLALMYLRLQTLHLAQLVHHFSNDTSFDPHGLQLQYAVGTLSFGLFLAGVLMFLLLPLLSLLLEVLVMREVANDP